jgi:membrane protease YdiL (CAAX protease family)
VGLVRLGGRCLPRRAQFGWIAFALASPLLLFSVSAYALSLATTNHVDWANVGRSIEYPALSRGAYCLANIVCYGFGEEVGWRGFALPRLQARHSALTSALLVSGVWAAWHLPLFAFAGGLSSMGIGGAVGWLFSLITGSVLMTCLFNSSGGSILAVALFHGTLDIVMTSPMNGPLPSVMGAIITICGLTVLLVFGRTNLARSPRVQDAAASVSAALRRVAPSERG